MEQAKIDILVIDMQMGCEQSFNLICQHFHASLLRFSFRICRNEQVAHDAVQNSWIKLTKSIKTLQDPRAFKSWLYQLVRWQTLDLIKKANNDVLSFTTDDYDCVVDEEQAKDHSDLLSLIDLLPAIDRQAIYLFYLEQLTIAEISVVVEVPVGTIKSRLNRARKWLKEQLITQEDV
jgi:RNA polymerase sigma-70 factor (ECF subfamily)